MLINWETMDPGLLRSDGDINNVHARLSGKYGRDDAWLILPGVFSFVCSAAPPVWKAPVCSLPPWLLPAPLPLVAMLFMRGLATNSFAFSQ